MLGNKIYFPISKKDADNNIDTNNLANLSQEILIDLYVTKITLLQTLEEKCQKKDDFYYKNYDNLNNFDRIQTRGLIQALQEIMYQTQNELNSILPLIVKH